MFYNTQIKERLLNTKHKTHLLEYIYSNLSINMSLSGIEKYKYAYQYINIECTFAYLYIYKVVYMIT